MKTDLTPQDVTTELIDAVAEYLVLRAAAEVTRQEVDKVQREILAAVELTDTREWGSQERITDPGETYRCRDDAAMAQYYQAVDTALRAADLKPNDMEFDYCPALVAEHDQLKAEWTIIDEAAKMLEVFPGKGEFNNALLCAKDGLAQRQKFIDLTVDLVLSL